MYSIFDCTVTVTVITSHKTIHTDPLAEAVRSKVLDKILLNSYFQVTLIFWQ